MSRVTIDIENIDDLTAEIINAASKDIVKELSIFAQTKLREAYEQSTYNHRKTQNLADSYLWAVYRDNVLQKKGYLYPTPKANVTKIETGTKRRVYGRKEADDFLAEYKPNLNGFVAVFAAVMYYGAYLENGTEGRQKYIVLTSILDDLENDPQLTNVKKEIIEHQY